MWEGENPPIDAMKRYAQAVKSYLEDPALHVKVHQMFTNTPYGPNPRYNKNVFISRQAFYEGKPLYKEIANQLSEFKIMLSPRP